MTRWGMPHNDVVMVLYTFWEQVHRKTSLEDQWRISRVLLDEFHQKYYTDLKCPIPPYHPPLPHKNYSLSIYLRTLGDECVDAIYRIADKHRIRITHLVLALIFIGLAVVLSQTPPKIYGKDSLFNALSNLKKER